MANSTKPSDGTLPSYSTDLPGKTAQGVHSDTTVAIPGGPHQLTWRLTSIAESGTGYRVSSGALDHLRWEPAITKASVLADLTELKATVITTHNYAFIPFTKLRLLATLNIVQLQINYGQYGAAATTLQAKILPRMDDCKNGVRPDWDDVVRTVMHKYSSTYRSRTSSKNCSGCRHTHPRGSLPPLLFFNASK